MGWRCKKSKKNVYMEIVEKYAIDEKGNGVLRIESEQYYNCESWDKAINILALEEYAEWIDERKEDKCMFKVGDEVTCIIHEHKELTRNRKYKVLKIIKDLSRVVVKNDLNEEKDYIFIRFDKLED